MQSMNCAWPDGIRHSNTAREFSINFFDKTNGDLWLGSCYIAHREQSAGATDMYVKQFSEGDPFRCAGNEFVMLLPRDETRACEMVLQMVRPGATTPSNSHESFMQVYLIWSGAAEIFIGSESRRVTAPAVAFIPPRTEHWVTNLSEDRELHYLYMSVWPEGIPAEEFDGGWKHVYSKIIDTYASRGYPAELKQ
jgi:quercetin dioxygenase-like cupin family protein